VPEPDPAPEPVPEPLEELDPPVVSVVVVVDVVLVAFDWLAWLSSADVVAVMSGIELGTGSDTCALPQAPRVTPAAATTASANGRADTALSARRAA
jgi:hypothetical protein